MVRNVHERLIAVPAERLAPLVDRVGGPDDIVWPSPEWPPMVLDRPLSVEPAGPARSVVRHVLEGRLTGSARLTWPVAIRWLHDAVLEDLFDRAEAAVGTGPERPARWSPWVRLLRRAMLSHVARRIRTMGAGSAPT
jgi:hypothetical protein